MEEPTPQTPTPQPTPPTFDYTSYQHRSGVVSLLLPKEWRIIDNSTPRVIDVEFIPPAGFGSRIILTVTNEAATSEADLLAAMERTLQANYENNDAYEQVSRSAFAEEQLEVEYIYADALGARGRETVLFERRGTYLLTLRTFLAERDSVALLTALETARSSLTIDTAIVWGSPVAAANPDDLFLVNTLVWQADGQTYYTGEVYNTSGTDVDDVVLQVAFCNASNAVLVEVEQPLGYEMVPSGGAVPFRIVTDGVGRASGLQVCVTEIRGRPAVLPDNYINDLVLDATASASFDRLIIRGDLTNPTLSPVTEIEVLVAAYNDQDQIVGQEIVALDEVRLLPGETIPFNHTLFALGGVPNRFTTLTQARTFDPLDASLAPVDDTGE